MKHDIVRLLCNLILGEYPKVTFGGGIVFLVLGIFILLSGGKTSFDIAFLQFVLAVGLVLGGLRGILNEKKRRHL